MNPVSDRVARDLWRELVDGTRSGTITWRATDDPDTWVAAVGLTTFTVNRWGKIRVSVMDQETIDIQVDGADRDAVVLAIEARNRDVDAIVTDAVNAIRALRAHEDDGARVPIEGGPTRPPGPPRNRPSVLEVSRPERPTTDPAIPQPGQPTMDLLHPERLGLVEGIRSVVRRRR